MKKIVIISSLLVIIDQLIKIIVTKNIILNSTLILVNNFFSLTYVKNTGAAFSILTDNVLLLIIISLASLVAIYLYFIKNKNLTKIEVVILGFLIGGLLGNLVDRVIYGYVVDYLSFTIFNYSFPIFNLADICLVLSTIALVFYMEVKDGNQK